MIEVTKLAAEQDVGFRLPEERSSSWQGEIEQFYFLEAELLDDRRYDDWLTMFADDLHYWMPTRANRLKREMHVENSVPGQVGLSEETKQTLGWRVHQFVTGMHWAEDPPSRTRHLVTNVRIAESEVADEFLVRSNFLVYRNRLEREVDVWVGERSDVLRRVGHRAWLVCRRTVILDQNVVLSKNLSIFF